MKSLTKLSLIILIAAVGAGSPAQAQSDSASSTNSAPPVHRRVRAPRFYGTIESIDAAGMTLTLKGRTNETTVKITSTTKITKDGQPATFSDAAVGSRVAGSGKKEDDGTWVARTLIIRNPRPNAAATTPPAATPAAPPQ